jgi:undecaprenyl diphosphate synthase
LNIEYLTIYSFSTENWTRPKTEVMFLLELLRRFISQDVAELHSSGVKIEIIGDRSSLDAKLVRMIEDAERLTAANEKLKLIVAFNYGSRQELARAAQKIAMQVQAGALDPASITVDTVSQNLQTFGVPDPDLLIRTGGEERISNFLLWQCAYAEFVFVPEFWPERRFGGLKAQTA